MKDWEYTASIEEMSEADVRARIEEVMRYVIADKIAPIPYMADIEQSVEYRCPELTARCPMTGQRDFYEVVIKFVPDQILPELKSLKYYLAGYDQLPISHEHLAAKVYQDFQAVVKPKQLSLELQVGVRGGIKTTVRIG